MYNKDKLYQGVILMRKPKVETVKAEKIISQLRSRSEHFDNRHKHYAEENPNHPMAYYFLGRKNTMEKAIKSIQSEFNC